jgi:tryptophan synthase beta subunit|tara:strand:+ start:241 stop:495 length:255 start_codon:yes stop_codon:yes gene_type:complete
MRLMAAEAACGVNVGGASTFENATNVRLVNSGASTRLVTVANAADVTLASITVAPGEVTFLIKDQDHQIFAAHAEVLGVPIIWS